MQAAIEVFINGVAGVFAGITVLYIAIRVNAIIATDKPGKQE